MKALVPLERPLLFVSEDEHPRVVAKVLKVDSRVNIHYRQRGKKMRVSNAEFFFQIGYIDSIKKISI